MKCFKVFSEEIEGRLDTFFYQPEFIERERIVKARSKMRVEDFVLDIAGGATPATTQAAKYYAEKGNSGIPFLRVQNLDPSGELQLGDVKHINKETHNGLLKRSQVSQDDLLVKITGVGRMAVSSVPCKGFSGNINQHIVRIKTKDRQTSEVLAAFLNSNIGERLASRRSTGGTRPALDYPALKSIPVFFDPKLAEVMREAHDAKKKKEIEAERLLNSFDSLLEKHLKLKLKNPVSKKMYAISTTELEGALNPERYAGRFNFDSAFQWETIEKGVGQINRETFTPSKAAPDDSLALMRIDDLANNPVNPVIRTVKGKDINGIILKVSAGDVLIARLGPTIENAKFVLAPRHDLPLVASNEFICLRCNEAFNRHFVLFVLRTEFYRTFMLRKSRGATPSRRRLSHEDFGKFPFLQIKRDLQDEIAQEMNGRINRGQELKQEAQTELEAAKQKVEKMIFGKED